MDRAHLATFGRMPDTGDTSGPNSRACRFSSQTLASASSYPRGMSTGATEGASTPASAIVVDRLAASESHAAAALLGRSFAGERMISYLLRGVAPDARAAALEPLFRAMLRTFAPHGELHAARLESRLVGVGIRVPPGAYPPSLSSRLAMMIRLIPVMARMALGTWSTWEVYKVFARLERLHPREAHWYLIWVGVEPQLQRQGVGTRLAQEVTGLADAHGMPCYLETFGEGTAALYRKHGFVVRDELRPIADGPEGWTLWRPARPVAT
jgi:GNAT superfamily N-acetyltransferase